MSVSGVSAGSGGTEEISGFPAGVAQGQRLCCTGLHDRYFTNKKYGSHSALNMFTEYSMTDPGELAEYFGFTEQEVSVLCENMR